MKHFFSWIIICCCLSAQATITLPALVRDSMILQRDKPLSLWGWAAAGEKITIRFNGIQQTTRAGSNHRWQLQLAAMPAGGPYTMYISGNNKLVLKDVWIGDVWLCAGQSNMEHQLRLHEDRYADEIAHASNPQIRQFIVPRRTDLQQPQDTLPAGNWQPATAPHIRNFSAVAYFFAEALYKRYKVSIGIINASVGGTPIEAWTSEEGLRSFPDLLATLQQNKDTGYVNQRNRAAAAFSNAHQPDRRNDKGLNGPLPWYDNNYRQSLGWRKITVPGYWEDQGIKELNGVVWYQKKIWLDGSAGDNPTTLYLGRIVDADEVYINGQKIGATSYQYPQRKYVIPAGTLKPGSNRITVRVTNYSGKGGFVPDKPYALQLGDRTTVDLRGEWDYKVGDVFEPYTAPVTELSAQNQPAALFNAMVAPLIPYTLKGILWYQGESNTGKPETYASLLPAFISDWRRQWQDTLPFVYAQLPGFMEMNYLPGESNWAIVREAQLQALRIPRTGMAVTIDLGAWNDVHPDDKKHVGLRLAMAAQKTAYDENIVASGPLFQSAAIKGDSIVISFGDTGRGLYTIDEVAPDNFAIAGADKKFVWAHAVIRDDKVIVWNSKVPQPLYVRYAWADNPHHANLYNGSGSAASPFRTDTTTP